MHRKLFYRIIEDEESGPVKVYYDPSISTPTIGQGWDLDESCSDYTGNFVNTEDCKEKTLGLLNTDNVKCATPDTLPYYYLGIFANPHQQFCSKENYQQKLFAVCARLDSGLINLQPNQLIETDSTLQAALAKASDRLEIWTVDNGGEKTSGNCNPSALGIPETGCGARSTCQKLWQQELWNQTRYG